MLIKRCLDLIFALLGLVFLLPLFIIISIWIKFDSPGPILFIQKRVGINGQIINVYKFRSMFINDGLKLTSDNDPRITKCGYYIRKYKLDEFAQLINVVNGTMSLVGPRPEVQEYIDIYPKDIKDKILSVRPGITDFASIEFKDENSLLKVAENPHDLYIKEILPIKQSYYIDYVDNRTIWLDIKIIFLTLIAVFK